MRKFAFVMSVAMLAVLAAVRPAHAILQFQKEFVNLYIGYDKDTDYAQLVKQARCFVCHQR